uniref:Uncharacterized protein n=1 Tax=Cucumis melo TaxID=3656 RepID=A0A9I9EFF0_CUCME
KLSEHQKLFSSVDSGSLCCHGYNRCQAATAVNQLQGLPPTTTVVDKHQPPPLCPLNSIHQLY